MHASSYSAQLFLHSYYKITLMCYQEHHLTPPTPALLQSLTKPAAQSLLGALAELAVGVGVGVEVGQEAQEVAAVVMQEQMVPVNVVGCNPSP